MVEGRMRGEDRGGGEEVEGGIGEMGMGGGAMRMGEAAEGEGREGRTVLGALRFGVLRRRVGQGGEVLLRAEVLRG